MAPGLIVEPVESGVSLAALTRTYDDTLCFYLNGTRVVLDDIDPEITLLEYLRGIGLTGTKLGCSEGGCGACTVVVSQIDPTTKKIYHASVNACLAPLISVDGKHVITVEGIGDTKNPHPAQQRIAVGNGSQCGFCTPGIVMSLYALIRNNPAPSEHEVEEAFDGNLCRCTGYRSILDAAQSFSVPSASAKAASCCQNGVANGEKPKANGDSGCCGIANGAGGCCKNGISNGEPIKKFVRPEFIPYDPSSQLIFPPVLWKHEFRPLVLGNKRKRWYRPVTVDQLLEIKSVCPSAKIIGGSSETQIETKFRALLYEESVYVGDIPELKQYSFKDDHLELGANVTLTELERVCDEALEKYGERRGQPFAYIKKQLKYFAGRQIRNVASPAGNIATASPISDLNPVFVATNTTLVSRSLTKTTEIPMSHFFLGYRRTALPADHIIEKLRVPVSQESGEYIRAYKQSKRKDDDIAIVTSALRVSLDKDNIVKSANLAYGGMAPTTVAAKKTETFLMGQLWTDPKTVEGAMNALGFDFDLPSGVPGGMPTYRKTLTLSFFYRFYHDVLSEIAGATNVDHEAVEEIERAISTGKKDETATQGYEQEVVGKASPHRAALQQTTGQAQYVDDIPPGKTDLFGCLVLSTKAHAKLVNVDFSPALDIPGVVDYVTHKDLPSPKANYWGAPVADEQFFAVDEVHTHGAPIGMVISTSPKAAERGMRAVKVEYEDLPALLTIEDAIKAKSFFPHRPVIKNGDVEEAFKNADHIFTGTSRMGGQEHFYLETQAAIAIPKPEEGEMEIISSTQNPQETQTCAAEVTGVTMNKIVSRVKRLGGGFGGKETRSVQLSSICALAASKTRRTVRCMLSRDEDIVSSGQRHPFRCDWKVSVKDGKLSGLRADIYCNAGHSHDLSHSVLERSLSHIDGPYKFGTVEVHGYMCRTNTVSNTAFRGFGGPQGLFFGESIINEVCDKLNISVEQFRRNNFYKADDITHFNQPMGDWFVPLMYEQVLKESDYENRRKEIEQYNRAHKWSKRGIAIIPTKFGISFTAKFLNQAGALVHCYRDGSVLVAHGGTEMGQGLNTKMIMIAAQALGIPSSSVFISETATNTVANTSATAASASSDLNGYAIYNACQQINERLEPYKKQAPDVSFTQWVNAAYFDRVNLSANGFYRTPDIGYDWKTNTGRMFFYFTQGVTAASVQIDTLTGDWTPLRTDIKMDVGRSINPSIDYGQIEGAYLQGQGLFTTEESLWHRASGQVATRGPGNYKIPGFRDIPQTFNVSLLRDVEWTNLRTIQRSRGVGEPPLFMGASVFFAIRHALTAARRQWGCDEVLSLRSPATPERIRTECRDPIVERSRVPDRGDSFFVAI